MGGNRELITEYLNPLLSSGGLVWSSNARPIPQICVGILDYIHLTPGIQLKVKVSYGWFTDGKYQERNVGEVYSYVKKQNFTIKVFIFVLEIPRDIGYLTRGYVWTISSVDTQLEDHGVVI